MPRHAKPETQFYFSNRAREITIADMSLALRGISPLFRVRVTKYWPWEYILILEQYRPMGKNRYQFTWMKVTPGAGKRRLTSWGSQRLAEDMLIHAANAQVTGQYS
jgi:hypothetical protein